MVQGDQMYLAAGGRVHVLQRRAAEGRADAPGRTGEPAPGGGALAAGAQDQQIARLLLSNAWCSFRYSQTSGTSSSERVQFFPDGTVAQGSNTETYSSGRGGTVAGQHRGGPRAQWRVQNSALMLSGDGATWSAQPLRITQNSNGYPIVTAGGKEYSQCR
jgi:hypothetical protein